MARSSTISSPGSMCPSGAPENPGSSLARATGHVVSILCVPYGYTVALWCAGVLTIIRYGMPSELEVLLFAAGAIGGFLTCAWAGRGHLDDRVPMRVPSIVVANVFPIVTTLAVIALPLGLVPKRWAYPLDSFLATVTYVLSLALLLRIAEAFAPKR